MRLLLDTNVLLWALTAPERIAPNIMRVLADDANEILFSAVSIWEIAIKSGLHRDDFQIRPELIVQAALLSGYIARDIRVDVALRVAVLPLHHRDPFDRLLVAQAMAEPAQLYTSDRALLPYSPLVQLVA